jgi:uncharacterized protein YecE (DUF72 family)
MAAKMHVGTSGYSFQDWLGTVYPSGLRSGDFLSHYASLFSSVEVNSTYYRVPSPRVFARMREKVPQDFTFIVKLPKEVTHERGRFDTVVTPFRSAVSPLQEAGQLGGLLAQFPYSFKAEPASFDHLKRLAEAFLSPNLPLSVEFRHAGWCTEEAFTALADLGLGFVNVDLPALENLPPASNVTTSSVAYYRLHGRNAKNWWEHPTASDRYDYLYSEKELEEWAVRVEEAARRTTACYVFQNNCHLGQSVVNALQLSRRLGLPRPTPPPGRPQGMFEPSLAELIDAVRGRIEGARRAKER